MQMWRLYLLFTVLLPISGRAQTVLVQKPINGNIYTGTPSVGFPVNDKHEAYFRATSSSFNGSVQAYHRIYRNGDLVSTITDYPNGYVEDSIELLPGANTFHITVQSQLCFSTSCIVSSSNEPTIIYVKGLEAGETAVKNSGIGPVRIQWQKHDREGTDDFYYRVFRNTTNGTATATALGSWSQNGQFIDFPTQKGKTYYWVRVAGNSSGGYAGEYSPVDSVNIDSVNVSANLSSVKGYQYWFDNNYSGRNTNTTSGSTTTSDLDVSLLAPGVHRLHMRYQGPFGDWSAVYSSYFIKRRTHSAQAMLKAEYWFNEAIHAKQSEPLSGVNGIFLDSLDLSGLTTGLNQLTVRFMDKAGNWSAPTSHYFIKNQASGQAQMSGYEYWWNDAVSAKTTGSLSGNDVLFLDSLSLSGLSGGLNTLHVRFRDAAGQWSVPISHYFIKNQTSGKAQMSGYEYWWNDAVSAKTTGSLSGNDVLFLDSLSLSGLSGGLNTLHIRFQDAGGNWSVPTSHYFIKNQTSGQAQMSVYEYWWNDAVSAKTTGRLSGNNVLFLDSLGLSGLSAGLNTLHVRFRDAGDNWSVVSSHYFIKNQSTGLSKIKAWQHWFDDRTDSITTTQLPSPQEFLQLEIPLMVPDTFTRDHYVHFRFQDLSGQWTVAYTDTFEVCVPLARAGTCTYCDLPQGHWAKTAGEYLCKYASTPKILDDDGMANPDDLINRAELAKMVYLSLELDSAKNYAQFFPSPFNDLQDPNIWYHDYAKALAFLDYGDGVSPFDWDYFNFRPANSISRAHVLKVLLEAWNVPLHDTGTVSFTDIAPSHDAFAYVKTALDFGIVQGDASQGQTFRPNDAASRSEVFQMLYRIMTHATLNRPSIVDGSFIDFGLCDLGNLGSDCLKASGFNDYAVQSFNIPGAGINLSFTHQYSSFAAQMIKELFPINSLGIGWLHSYQCYLLHFDGITDMEKREVIVWPDANIEIYKPVTGGFETLSHNKYNELKKLDTATFTLTTKSQQVYTFKKLGTNPDFPFVLVSIEDRNANQLSLSYEQSANYQSGFYRLKTVTGTCGQKLNFSYKSGTDLIAAVNGPISSKIQFEYTGNNNHDAHLHSFVNQLLHTTYYQYFPDRARRDLLKSIILPKGNRIDNEYDRRKLVSTQYSTDQTAMRMTTSGKFRNPQSSNYFQSKLTTAEGFKVVRKFGAEGQLLSQYSPLGATNLQYNNSGHPHKPTAVLTPKGALRGLKYDSKGNLLEAKLPKDVRHRFVYNALNDLTLYTDPLNKKTQFRYDSKGNLLAVQSPSGKDSFNYDSKGLVLKHIDPENNPRSFGYDCANLTSITDANGHTETYDYDSLGRATSYTDAENDETSYDYDLLSQLLSTSVNNHTTRYFYDKNGNLIRLKNAKGSNTLLQYNAKDLLIQQKFGNSSSRFSYYEDGKLDSLWSPNGHVFKHQYDTVDNLLSDGYATYTYTSTGNLSTAAKNGHQIAYTYDSLDRATAINYGGHGIGYQFNDLNQTTKITYASGKEVSYRYNSEGELASVHTWTGDSIVYTYTDDGLISSIAYSNGVSKTVQYDDANRVTKLVYKKPSNNVFMDYQYSEYFDDGNIKKMTCQCPLPNAYNLSADSLIYDYDSLGKLKAYHIQDLSGMSDYNLQMDANGNVQQIGNDISYQFDERNNIISFKEPNDSFQFTYDAFGNRKSKTHNGTITNYVLDLQGLPKVLIEKDGNGNVLNYYIYGHGLEARINAAGRISFFHTDYRGSVTAITNDSARVTHQYAYDPFGKQLAAQEEDFNPFRYVGAYGVMFDDTTLYYMRARYYVPYLGRFVSEDPIWHPNLYNYAGNNPVMMVDYDGELPIPNLNVYGGLYGVYDLQNSGTSTEDIVFSVLELTAGGVDDLISSVERFEIAQKLTLNSPIKYRASISASTKWFGKFGAFGVGDALALGKTGYYAFKGDGRNATKSFLVGGFSALGNALGGPVGGFVASKIGEGVHSVSWNAGNNLGTWIYDKAH